MRLHAAGRITSADRGQRDGMCVERAGVRMLVVNPNGTIRCANMGAAGSNQSCVGSLCYPIP